jgi:hypothetical protein
MDVPPVGRLEDPEPCLRQLLLELLRVAALSPTAGAGSPDGFDHYLRIRQQPPKPSQFPEVSPTLGHELSPL